MAQLADRIGYRLAGLVWTAIYSGLSRPASRVCAAELSLVRAPSFEEAMPAAEAVAA